MSADRGPIPVPSVDMYRYSATVNGKRRDVVVYAPKGTGSGAIESEFIDNIEANYKRFYRGATPEDFEAEREDVKVEIYGWHEVDW